MKIAVMGAGGVGGYYGGLLAQAGHDVTFIARGLHLQAIREDGLQVKSVFGDFRVSPAKAADDPTTIGPVDLVLFATKTYHTDQASEAIKPVVGPDTVVVSFQNGVDAAERIGNILGAQHMLGGATWLSAAIESPGVIGQYSAFRRIALGEFDGGSSPRLKAVGGAFESMGAAVELVEDIAKVLWTKFVFISSVSALGCLTRVAFGEYRSVPETRAALVDSIREVSAVARAKGINIDPDVVEKTLAFIDDSAPNIRPSMQRDLEAGRMTEVESLIGIVVRLGTEMGVATPVMRLAYAAIKPADLAARS